jgi:integrase/recombinase XerD
MQLKPHHKPSSKHWYKSLHTPPLLPRAALPRYLTQDEVTRLFKVISSPRDRALLALIYHYGLRVEEATLLTLEDVNLKDLHIRVHRLKHGVSTQKPLWRHNAKLLRSYLRIRQDAGHYLFTGRQGALKKWQIQQLFTTYAKKAGIRGRSIHSLRHSIAVHLLEAGQGIEYVADHLGHKNIQNTRISAQSTTSLRQEVFAKLKRHPKIVRVA